MATSPVVVNGFAEKPFAGQLVCRPGENNPSGLFICHDRPPSRYRPFSYGLCRSPYGSWGASYELCRSSYELWSAPYELCRSPYGFLGASYELCRSSYECRRRVNKPFPALYGLMRRPADDSAVIRTVPAFEPTSAIKKKGERPFALTRNQHSLLNFSLQPSALTTSEPSAASVVK